MEAACIQKSKDRPKSGWINGPRWDIGWLIGSSLIVPIVLLFVWMGTPGRWINIGVTAIVGGPHLFATFTATYMDRRFRRSHTWFLLAAAIGVPCFVVWMTLLDFQILLSFFIFSASVHVLHQNAYLADIYRRKEQREESMASRLIDYGLLMLCIFPIATYKIVNGTFYLGDIEIIVPRCLMVPQTYWTVWILFGTCLTLWVAKTLTEYRRGIMNIPKTLLIGFTTIVAFLVPMASKGERLELAFQSVNAWHSIQYLGIVWFIQKVRKDNGLIESAFIRKISGGGRSTYYFYGICFLTTMGLLTIALTLHRLDPLGLAADLHLEERYYYMVVLSALLTHYVLDAYLFTVSNRKGVDVTQSPFAAARMGS